MNAKNAFDEKVKGGVKKKLEYAATLNYLLFPQMTLPKSCPGFFKSIKLVGTYGFWWNQDGG